MKLSHFLGKNYDVASRPSKAKASAMDGELQVDGLVKPYWSASSMSDAINGILNLDAVNRQLWPWDWTAHTMLRVCVKYDFFSLERDTSRRLKVFEQFFNCVSRSI